MSLPPQPWEFRSKPAWQRLITMLGGVIVNIILGLGIFSAIFYVWGQDFLPVNNLKQGVYVDPIFREVGFENGDKIFALDGKQINDETTLGDISWSILTHEASKVTVLRNGKRKVINIPDDMDARVMANQDIKLMMAPFPFVIDSVVKDGKASKEGFQKNDSLVSINTTPISSLYFAQEILQKNKGKNVSVTVSRNGQRVVLSSKISPEGMLGVRVKGLLDFPEINKLQHKSFTFFESLIEGPAYGLDVFSKKPAELMLMFNKNSGKHVGSILSMRKQFSPKWVWKVFWVLTANLSLVLAFFNLLPIPGLDGGHVMMTLYEMVTRRKPSQKFLETAQSIGMILLLSLMVFALGNDIFRGRI